MPGKKDIPLGIKNWVAEFFSMKKTSCKIKNYRFRKIKMLLPNNRSFIRFRISKKADERLVAEKSGNPKDKRIAVIVV